MSGDIAAGSCPAYAVVDSKRKKKKVTEIDQESSAGIALYAVVDKTRKKEVLSPEIHKNDDDTDYSNVEGECIESRAIRKEKSQFTHSVPQQEKASKVVLSKTSSFGGKVKKCTPVGSIFQLGVVVMILFASFLILAFGITIGVAYSMISSLRSEIALLKSKTYQLNESTILNRVSLKNRINMIESATFGRTMFIPAPSCQAIHKFQPSPSSGYYWVKSSNGSSVRVYCDMTKTCGSVTGGLTRVAILNNETRPQLCTTGDFWSIDKGRCIRSTEDPGCSHIVFPEMNIAFSHICGTVEAFWFGSPDGFTGSNRSSSTTVNDNYVDGISLTYGNTSNRIHIWTFIADGQERIQSCPHEVPEYVGHNYSCLNDEDFCMSNSCYFTFFRQLQQPATDIEMRLCRDQRRSGDNHEGIYLGNIEIYVW